MRKDKISPLQSWLSVKKRTYELISHIFSEVIRKEMKEGDRYFEELIETGCDRN
jgi:hypothetical protein